MKVLTTEDGFIGFQNGIYQRNGVSGSAIRLWRSQDGLAWKPIATEPLLHPQGNDWIAEPILPLPVVYSVLPHTALPIALYIGSVRCDIPPPVPLPLDTGRDRINWIQIYRC